MHDLIYATTVSPRFSVTPVICQYLGKISTNLPHQGIDLHLLKSPFKSPAVYIIRQGILYIYDTNIFPIGARHDKITSTSHGQPSPAACSIVSHVISVTNDVT